jgi:hypothetical protein
LVISSPTVEDPADGQFGDQALDLRRRPEIGVVRMWGYVSHGASCNTLYRM